MSKENLAEQNNRKCDKMGCEGYTDLTICKTIQQKGLCPIKRRRRKRQKIQKAKRPRAKCQIDKRFNCIYAANCFSCPKGSKAAQRHRPKQLTIDKVNP